MTVSESRMEKALAYLVESAEGAAKARAERLYLEEYTKHLQARLMSELAIDAPGLAVSAQERDARASDAYRTHLEGLRAAIETDEGFRYKREAESAVLDAWRSLNANLRRV